MASNTTNFGLVQTLYIAFYQRPADPDGLVFWANEVTTKGRDAVINAFATSDEATALYGAITNDNIVSVVNQIYQALFNRDAEVATTTDAALGTVAGENFYVSGFKAGKFTPGQIALNVFDGVRGDDATVLANKVAYANEFTAQVDGRPFTDANFGLLTTADAVTYNADDVTAARVALQAVTASTTVTPALVATDVQGTIANEGDTAFSVANGVVTAPAALTQIRATFVSAEVGNGNANNAAAELAVALQQEDNADALIGAEIRVSDEGTTLTAKNGQTFDVRDVSGAQRGNMFTTVKLGTNASEVVEAAATATYINAGAGNDAIVGGAGADFLVGNGGDDQISAGAGDSVIGGAGTDTVIVTGTRASYLVNDGTNAVTLTSQTGGTINLVKVAGVNSVENIRFSDATVTVEELIAPPALGQTYALTKGLDNVQGTAGNDTIIGSIDSASGGNAELNTLSSIDIVNGGSGVDTLKIAHASSASGVVTLANISNVEVIEIESAYASGTTGVTVDTTAVTGVTNLNITKAAASVSATAAATTDVAVTVKENGAGSKLAHSIVGGKNVTVTATEMGTTAASGDSITIGSGTAPKGDVVVNLTGAKYAGGSPAFGSGDTVVINGGKTVSVTQVASSDTSFAATSAANSGSGVTQADVKVIANADTTTINIKQDVATAVNAKATTGGVTETATVKFGALKAGNTLTLDVDGSGSGNSGITLTAKEDMTAADVAQAFANLVANSARLNASGVVTTAGDTQGSIAYTKATYALDTSNSGSGTSLWSSAAASGDTVVFTAATANTPVADLVFTASGSGSNAPVITSKTDGKAHDATFTGGVMGAIAGKVEVVGAAALKTVTIDGFGSGSNTSGTTALETLNLSNSAGNAFTVGNAAATLNLNLEKVTDALGSTGSGVTISSGAATLNVKSVGNNVLTAADATTVLNVSGNGILTGGASGGLDTIKTITVSETAGLNFAAAGSGLTALESVNTTATTGTVIINIAGTATYTGGSGVDIVTVTNASGTGISKAIDLGAGNDTLTLNGTGTTTPTVDIKGGSGDADTLSMTAGTASGLTAAYMAKVTGFERLTLNDQIAADTTVNLKTLGFTNYVTTSGYGTGASGSGLVLQNLADNGTVVLAGAGTGSGAVQVSIEGAADIGTNVINVIANNSNSGASGSGNLNVGKLIVNEVETINLTATDLTPTSSGTATIDTITLALTANKATSVNLGTSNSNLTLNLDATTNKLATVDGNAMTGNLTVNLTAQNGVAMTVKGGAGADVLAASAGVNAKADVLNGGAGNDTLYAGTNGAKLTGGLGNDLFVVMDSAASGSSGATPFVGNKQVNTFSTIEDFQTGDVLQLLWNASSGSGTGTTVKDDAAVNSFAKLSATLDAGTAVFTDYVSAAMQQAAATTTGTGGDAVWFKVGNDSYVVIDNGVETTGAFVNGEDLIVKLTGVDLTSASFNTTFGTVTL